MSPLLMAVSESGFSMQIERVKGSVPFYFLKNLFGSLLLQIFKNTLEH